jgi:hypothetical protein
MYRFEEILLILDQSLNSKKRRHITGGVLLSISLLFGGMAFTIITIKTEDNDNDVYLE